MPLGDVQNEDEKFVVLVAVDDPHGADSKRTSPVQWALQRLAGIGLARQTAEGAIDSHEEAAGTPGNTLDPVRALSDN